jgi:hypothetical protein
MHVIPILLLDAACCWHFLLAEGGEEGFADIEGGSEGGEGGWEMEVSYAM